MERSKLPKKFNFPDLINSSLTKNFTQVPNELLRNPEISSKAKIILCILLSNRDGWKNHIVGLRTTMKEGLTTIQNALTELEKHGYLLRVMVRNERTKVRLGSFWTCSDIPGEFDLKEHAETFMNKGFELYHRKPYMEKPHHGFPIYGKLMPNNTIINNKKKNKTSSSSKNGYITKSMFDKFWKIYPKNAGKGAALTSWDKICRRPIKDRPTWHVIRSSVLNQIKTDQWKDSEFIANASTWLNQSRWLDDPAEMKTYTRSNTKQSTGGSRTPKAKSNKYAKHL